MYLKFRWNDKDTQVVILAIHVFVPSIVVGFS